MTAKDLEQRGYCCGQGCKECPYYPRHEYGNTVLAKIIKKESINFNKLVLKEINQNKGPE